MRQAVVIIVRDRDGRVLSVSRTTPPHEMTLPGGHVEDGETPREAAIRELREETCLVVKNAWQAMACTDPTKPGEWHNVVLDSPEEADVRVHVFQSEAFQTDSSFDDVAADGEIGGHVEWLTPDELLERAGKFKPGIQKLLDLGLLESQFNAKDGGAVAMDLGVGDVHVPSATRPKEATMADLPTKKRDEMPDSGFAWPEQRKFPVHDAAHVRNAAARLAQEVKAGRISKGTAAKIHSRIVAAGKKFGVEITSSVPSDGAVAPRGPYHKPAMTISYDHPEHGKFEIRHMSDKPVDVRLPPVDISGTVL